MALPYPLSLGDFVISGDQQISLPGGQAGQYAFSVRFNQRPSAGKIWVEYLTIGSETWEMGGPSRDVSDTLDFTAYGAISKVRVRSQGLALDGTDPYLWVALLDPYGFPIGAFEGLRALTVQPYTETNVKRGLQYELSGFIPALASLANSDGIFITGNSPVIIKGRQIAFDGAELQATVYEGPTYTGGVAATYYNLSDINPIAGGVTVLGGVTVTNPGRQISATTYYLGSTASGQNRIGTFGTPGNERVLAPNRTYLLRTYNPTGVAQKVTTYISWYEGVVDLPLPTGP